ncbi:AraC family transcriptional regulator [Pseudomonas sp. 5P_3.1_Bac2]|uniref:AraC family transcriptional regulator n=1 Tax=Pseudomonas sp. 5P_3.1_Bac2 TaxID=2971617 RepID=UPI0021C82540|nr:AraC family transcriptional regulator [Pseudomonas sp. 5P_3.1_Bac2]MCU1717070.1 AraC family transcriptional regulator [Pseudomonas sp. 5P_3.1_Bac2]
MTDYARASSLHGIAEFASSQQVSVDDLFKRAGLSPDILDYPENLITYQSLLKILEQGALSSNNPLFALQFGMQQNLAASIRPLLYVMRNAGTCGEALQELSRYYQVHASSARVHIEIEEGHAFFYYSPAATLDLSRMQPITELVLGGGLQVMRMLLGNRWQPQALMLQHAPAKDLSAYHRLLGITPTFNAPANAWVFDAKLLETPLISADHELQSLIRQHLDNLGQITVEDLPSHVQQVVRSFLPQGRASIEHVADYLALSTRTLQRYLAEEGTSFNQLVDQTRRAIATRYMTDSNMSFTQLSELLGYAELSAFSRAFQRWYGMSPRQWQKNQGSHLSKRRLIATRR